MKKLFFLLLIFSFKSSYSQDDISNYPKLLSDFTEAYYYYAAHNPSFNYFESLDKASNSVLNFYNPIFRKFKSELREHFATSSDEELITKAADTIIKGFGKKYLWKGEEAAFQKYEKTLSVYSDQICSCISTHWSDKMGTDKLLEVVNSCEQAMVKDQAFMNRIKVYMINFSTAEKLGMPKYASKYSYQNCQYINRILNSVLVNSVYGNYFSNMRSSQHEIIDSIFLYTSRNKIDSLSQFFPDFQKYMDAIKESIKISQNSNASSIDISNDQNITTVTKTFIAGDKKPELIGQVVYKLQKNSEDFPFVLSFEFTPANKIKNRKKILEGLEFPPPMITPPTKE